MKNTKIVFSVALVVAAIVLVYYAMSSSPKSADVEGEEFKPWQGEKVSESKDFGSSAKQSEKKTSEKSTTKGGVEAKERATNALKLEQEKKKSAVKSAAVSNPAPLKGGVGGKAPTRSEGEKRDQPTARMSKAKIREVISKQFAPLAKACYETLLKEFPDASGKVRTSFHIINEEGEGRVELSTISAEGTTLMDEPLHDCLSAKLGDLRFDAPEGDGKLKVNYPFIFSTEEDAP